MAQSHALYVEKAMLDIGFPSVALADKAQAMPFYMGKFLLPCIRTCSPLDVSTYLRLDNLSTTLEMNTLHEELCKGLEAYGRILSLSIAGDE